MTASIKKRMGATAGRKNDREIRALLSAVQADLTALRSTVGDVVTDVATIGANVNNALNQLDVDSNVALNNYFSSNNVTVSSAAPSALTLTS